MDEYNIPVETQQPQQEAGYNIPVTSQDVPLDPAVAASRASKAEFGLQGKVDKDYGDYYSSFVAGQERYMRNYITTQLQQKIANQRNQAYITLSNAKQGAILPEDVDQLVDYMNDPK